MVSATVYILYAGIFGIENTLLWLSLGLMFLEVVVLLVFKWGCPLTHVARKYSPEDRENFDIYLPNWLAKHNKMIFGTMLCVGIALHVARYFLKA
jgi:hypothetical protein